MVVKSGAPTAKFPVFAQVTSSAASAIASCGALMNSWYCVPVVSPPPPVTVGKPGVRTRLQSLLRVKSQLGVISADRSVPMSSSREPSLWVGFRVTVGSEASSATNGSSVRIVAGKKRSPAKPCASASALGNSATTVAATRPRQSLGRISHAPQKIAQRRGPIENGPGGFEC